VCRLKRVVNSVGIRTIASTAFDEFGAARRIPTLTDRCRLPPHGLGHVLRVKQKGSRNENAWPPRHFALTKDVMAVTPEEMKWDAQGGSALPGMEQVVSIGDPAR